MKFPLFWLLALLLFSPTGFALPCQSLLSRDLHDTLKGLEKMRGQNFLLKDTLWLYPSREGFIKSLTLQEHTSPTNIAVDLLLQANQGELDRLEKILTTLESLPYHQDSGLFFSWYSTKKNQADGLDVSAIDNLHLNLALWTIREIYPEQQIGKKAADLFERMDFSAFYDEASGLIGGNLRFHEGKWNREAYLFDYLGSEARLLYSLGWALKLFKKYPQDQSFITRAISNLKMETVASEQGPLLKLWDGALFQLYFPKMFINEELYSLKFKDFYQSTLKFIIAEGERRGLPFPAAHTPGRRAFSSRLSPAYQDKSGVKGLVSSSNQDLQNPELDAVWENIFSPHGLFMAATSDPKAFSEWQELRQMRTQDRSLYLENWGWMDSVLIDDKGEQKVISSQLALNQGMLALALLQMHHEKGLSLSSQSLYHNPQVRERLKTFYQLLDQAIP